MFHKLFILSFIGLIFSAQSSFGEMVLSSDSILEGKIIKESACRNKGGRDISPQLTLSGIPEGTKSISIIMDDPDAIKPAKNMGPLERI